MLVRTYIIHLQLFRRSPESLQPTIFNSNSTLLSGKSLKIYEDPIAWHNQFRNQITMRIDESIFEPLYNKGMGTPNASIRILISMMLLKEAEGLSDQKLFENCRFNMLTRNAIGLVNADDTLPSESTYYLFRKKVFDYARAGNENLFDVAFLNLTKSQSLDFNVSGKHVLMDSKLLGSNIAWLSRYELVHETLKLFYQTIKDNPTVSPPILQQLETLFKSHDKGSKIVYTHTTSEVKTKFEELGCLIYQVLDLFPSSEQIWYLTLKRVFEEQYKVDHTQVVLPLDKEEISAKSVQSPHDTDCHFRNKDGNKVKGYAVNVTESCDDDQELNLIGNVEVREVSTSDTDFLQNGTCRAQEVFTEKIERIHADGAYHSPENQEFCSKNNIDLHLHAIQGAKGRYQLERTQNQQVSVLDTQTNQQLQATKVKNKKGVEQWRIKTAKGYRYFTQQAIETSMIRKKIAQTPKDILQKRNNVEATIFQLGYHYPNAKSRYRGLIKHQMWANVRCLWVNFVRILKFVQKTFGKTTVFSKSVATQFFNTLILVFRIFLNQENRKIQLEL